MIICSCHGVTERQLRAACKSGGPATCPAGTGCGGCVATISAIVEECHRGAGKDDHGSSGQQPQRQDGGHSSHSD